MKARAQEPAGRRCPVKNSAFRPLGLKLLLHGSVGFRVDLAPGETFGQNIQGFLARRGIGDYRGPRRRAVIFVLSDPGIFRPADLDGYIDDPRHHHEQSYS